MPIQQMIVQTLGHHLCRTDRIRKGTRQAVLLSAFIAEANNTIRRLYQNIKKSRAAQCITYSIVPHRIFYLTLSVKADIHSPLSQLRSI